MPAAKQVDAVAKKLMELNPGFDGEVTGYIVSGAPKMENGVVTEFGFATNKVADIWPVRALAGLKKLNCSGREGEGKLSDLSPLAGLPLTELECSHTQVFDLSPLRGMKLTALDCAVTNVSNLAPLLGMPLVKLMIDGTKVDDLLPLTGMKLKEISLSPGEIRVGLEILQKMSSLQKLRDPPAAALLPRLFWKKYDVDELPDKQVSSPFVLFDGPKEFWASRGFPIDALKQLKAVTNGNQGALNSFAFTPGGDWILLAGSRFFSSNVNLPACVKLAELEQPGVDFKCAAFTPDGAWTILWNDNGNWTKGSVPPDAFNKMQEVIKGGSTLRSIAFGPGKAWVLMFDKAGVLFGNVPSELAKVLDNAAKKSFTVSCVAFTGSDWICLSSGGWWASNANLPAAKVIAKNIKQGYPPKWIAFAPPPAK